MKQSAKKNIPSPDSYSGGELRRYREAKNISLESIAEKTCINITYLHYLEAEAYSSFPPLLFFKSYLKQYAENIGLDSDEVSIRYMKRYEDWKSGLK